MDKTFLKWAGGKNWFIRYQNHRFPIDYNRYIDPFLGGGSIYFYLEPRNAIISDINQELITTYIAIKNNYERVHSILKMHNKKHDKEYYYKIRDMRPRKMENIAARMIYLNRTCFNGIYRVNRKGIFNVPIGTNDKVLLDSDRFDKYSEILQNATVLCQDFEVTIDMALEGDFLFCDPPYLVQNDNNRFVGYTEQLFNWNDQVRLSQALHRAKERGVKIIMTNVNHESVKSLYENIDGYTLDEVVRYSSISGNSNSRKKYSEVIVSANII